MVILLTIIRRRRYIGCSIEIRRLPANTDRCRIVARSDGPETYAGWELEAKNECVDRCRIIARSDGQETYAGWEPEAKKRMCKPGR